MVTPRPPKIRRTGPPADETTSSACELPLASDRTNAIVRPSGDQAGLESFGARVRRRTAPPDAETIETPLGVEKAIWSPLGDQAAPTPPRARKRSRLPSEATVQIPNRDPCAPEKASLVPFGDQLGASKSRGTRSARGVTRRCIRPSTSMTYRLCTRRPLWNRSLQNATLPPRGDHLAPPSPPSGPRLSARRLDPSARTE